MGVFRPVSRYRTKGRLRKQKLDFKWGCTFFTPQRISGEIVRKSDKAA